MKKFKFSFFILAMVIALAGSFAFNVPDKGAKKVTVYHYTSSSVDIDDLKNYANWQGSSSSGSCGAYGSIPCAFTYPDNFETHLASFGSAEALINAADTRRDP